MVIEGINWYHLSLLLHRHTEEKMTSQKQMASQINYRGFVNSHCNGLMVCNWIVDRFAVIIYQLKEIGLIIQFIA